MNIQDTLRDLKQQTHPIYIDEAEWLNMVMTRNRTHEGFAQVEMENGGVIKDHVSLSTKLGQEVFRVFAFRVLEELSEAMTSYDPDHRKEELIDCFNYVVTCLLLDSTILNKAAVAKWLHREADLVFGGKNLTVRQGFTYHNLGHFTKLLCGDVGDTLRNRAWMRNAQDHYFSGEAVLLGAFSGILNLIFSHFSDTQEFRLYFLAKDAVLQFRLKSHY